MKHADPREVRNPPPAARSEDRAGCVLRVALADRGTAGSEVLPPKLVRPSAAGLVARERVFALLDRFRRPIMWVDGPPGGGKTSLISSWIETRALRCLWYKLDARDADPVTFFRQLAQAAPAHAARLPMLHPGHPSDLAGFARRFFRALLECTPGLEIVVLDDYQHIAEGSPLPILVHEFARVDPAPDHLREGLPCMLSIKGTEPAFSPRTGISVVVLSHSRPPEELAGAVAYGKLTRLGWEDLRPDIEETRRIATARDSAREPLPRAPYGTPWQQPIQIATLGRFQVIVSGDVLRHTRKAQRRVLDLLKALVALGPEGVIKDTVAGALWPDSEGDAARDAFEVTLHRLRKLLGRDEAVQLTHGMLQVNRALVWVDSSAFERLAAEANGEHGALNVAAAEGALTLYGGPFLQNEEDTPWLLPARERLRSRYIRLAIRTAQHFEHTGDPARAAEIYAVALEAEPLAEEVYRRLMLVLAGQGRRAEALDAYRRCRHLLSVVLGVAPSRETEALHHAIAQAA